MYTKTIVIDFDMLSQIQEGKIKIRSGQWIQYQWLQTKSRFVGVTKTQSVWSIHNKYNKYTEQARNIKRFQ